MQIETFKMFCDLAETESFTKAAQMSGVTQSAVSQQISALERIFKSVLIERRKKKFRLTRNGHALYDYGKQIVQDYDELNNKLHELKDIISGNIRVSTIYSIGLHELPASVKKFMMLYPTVKIHVEYRHFHQVYEDVLSNAVEFGLVACPFKDSRLDIVALRKEPFVLICHPQHPFAKLTKVKLKDLTGQKMVGFETDIPTRNAVDRILKQHGVEVKYVMEFDNVDTVKRAVEIDAGISIVPEVTVAQEIAKQTLVAVPIADGDFYRPIAAIFKKHQVLSPAMKQFLTVLKEAA